MNKKLACIFVGAQKKDQSYVGRINIYDGYTFLWAQTSEIERINANDALNDAFRMKEDFLQMNFK